MLALLKPLLVFFLAGLCEIGGGYLAWQWLKAGRSGPPRSPSASITPTRPPFPAKPQRNFDVEASLWHDGKVWLFTKDRGQQRASKVYTLPDQPGRYTAQLVTSLSIPGEVTDAALRADGHRLVLLARSELFVMDGNSWADILKAKPRHLALSGAGQTEGATFKDNQTLLLTTE